MIARTLAILPLLLTAGTLPAAEPGQAGAAKTAESWLFLDEIAVNPVAKKSAVIEPSPTPTP